jgi:hypothetical protein
MVALAEGTHPLVESKMGAVAWGQWPTPRSPSALIELDVRSYRIRLSDWLHRKAHTGLGLSGGQPFLVQHLLNEVLIEMRPYEC